MEILKIRHLKHSGLGPNPIHERVINEFRKSEAEGVYYCKARGWNVHITETLLTIKSPAVFGFGMVALIKR